MGNALESKVLEALDVIFSFGFRDKEKGAELIRTQGGIDILTEQAKRLIDEGKLGVIVERQKGLDRGEKIIMRWYEQETSFVLSKGVALWAPAKGKTVADGKVEIFDTIDVWFTGMEGWRSLMVVSKIDPSFAGVREKTLRDQIMFVEAKAERFTDPVKIFHPEDFERIF